MFPTEKPLMFGRGVAPSYPPTEEKPLVCIKMNPVAIAFIICKWQINPLVMFLNMYIP